MTVAVDDLQFLHPIKVGDLIILKAHVTCVSARRSKRAWMCTRSAYLTFVAVAADGCRVPVPPLLIETKEERRVCTEAEARRARRLEKKTETLNSEL